MDLAVSADYRVKLKGNEERDKYLDLYRELKKLWNMKVMLIPIVIGVLRTILKGLIKRWENLEIRAQVEIGQNTEDSWRFAVTQTPMKDHQLTLVWKALKE